MNAHPYIHASPNPHLARLGGPAAVTQLVAAFYKAMDERVDARVIRAMHGADLTETRAVLVRYLTEWLGGPKLYSDERGPPALRRRHHRFEIDASAREAWMACMRQALDEVCADAELRATLEAAFAKIADHMQNIPAVSTHRST